MKKFLALVICFTMAIAQLSVTGVSVEDYQAVVNKAMS